MTLIVKGPDGNLLLFAGGRRLSLALRRLRLLEEAGGVVPEELLARVRLEARPGEDVFDRLRELAFHAGSRRHTSAPRRRETR